MNLQNHDADTGADQDMTPMIDVVFLLIIFFMIITDLTQQDLEEIELPVAQTSVPDEPDREVVRPVVNIDYEGLTIVKGRVRYDPESDDTTDLEGYLADQARRMPVKLLDETKPIGPRNPQVPDNPLLIRADRTSEFKFIQEVMEICGRKDIRIWKLEPATQAPMRRPNTIPKATPRPTSPKADPNAAPKARPKASPTPSMDVRSLCLLGSWLIRFS